MAAPINMLRTGVAMLAIALCLLLGQAAARFGFSRLLARYALATNSIPAADEAIRLTPADPDAHRARATVLSRLGTMAEAKTSAELAVRLRHRDDRLWLELGDIKEELGDNEGALAAFDEAVRWAPYYAHTHWQRGNLKLRLGRYDEAFVDLRQAAASNRKLFPNLIDLAWGLSREDVKASESLIQIKNDNDRLGFARFLAAKGRGKDVVEQVGLLAAPVSVENRHELARLLFAAKAFRDAYALWNVAGSGSGFVNGGFEEPLVLSGATFGWIVSAAQTRAKLAIETAEKLGGERSMHVGFAGEWSASKPLLSQTIVIEAGRRYRVNFGVKTRELISGGPPVIVVRDAMTDQLLATSDSFPQATGSWQTMSIEFTAPANSEAVVIGLERNNCPSSPCPIFGMVWLDNFSLETFELAQEESPAKALRR